MAGGKAAGSPGSVCASGQPGMILSQRHRAQRAELLGCPVLISFGTSLSVGILLLISAFLIPKSNVRWVKYQCDCTEAFSRVEESEESMHFSKARMKTWLKSFAEMLLADHHSHLWTPSILPTAGSLQPLQGSCASLLSVLS